MDGFNVNSTYIAADTTAADADGVAQSQTPAAGGAQSLTLNGAETSGGVATFTAARRVTVTSAGDDRGRTFTITGTDVHGDAQTEVISGPNAALTTGTSYFRTVTDVTVDANTAGAVTVGMSNDALDVVFKGRMRIRGLYVVNSAAAGTLPFRNTSASGDTILTVGTVASATTVSEFIIPGRGVLFPAGCYLAYTAGTTVFTSATVFY